MDLISTDINVYLYSTCSLLFLAGSVLQFRFTKTTRVTVRIFSVGCMLRLPVCFQFENEPKQPPVVTLYSWTAQVTLFTDPLCSCTVARSSKYIIKTPGKCFPAREKTQMLLNTTFMHQTDICHNYISDPEGQHTLFLWLSVSGLHL